MSLLRDGRYYDALHGFMVRDVEYWRQLAGPEPRRVLELACGTGRVAIPLARDGHRVTGIDLEASMIEVARGKVGELPATFVRADMRDLDPALGPFDLVIFPFNGLRLLIERDDADRCLAGVRRALAPGGRFALDVTAPVYTTLVPEFPVTTHHHRDPMTGQAITATHRRTYDWFRQLVTLDATFAFADGTTVEDHLVQRVYFPQEIAALLAHHDLRVSAHHGDYDRSPPGPASPQLLLVAEAG